MVPNLTPDASTLMAMWNLGMMPKSFNGLGTPSPQLSRKRALLEVSYDEDACYTTAVQQSMSHQQSSKRSRFEAPRPSETKVAPSSVGLSSYEANDVLSGRGGGTNQHEGNCHFRTLINKNREQYLRAKKNDKPFISLAIVDIVRRRNGRFLKKDEDAGLWYEIGDDAAREKTSQALRQRAPEYRKQLLEKDTIKRSSSSRQPSKSLSPLPAPKISDGLIDLNTALSSETMAIAQKNDHLYQALVNARLRQAQLREAQEALRLQQKLSTIKLLEMMLKKSSSPLY